MIQLTWKKRLFANTYILFDATKQLGFLSEKSFSQRAEGTLGSKIYTFKTTGFFKQTTEILEGTELKPVGNIYYNSWMTKATITLENKIFRWEYLNIWNSKWRLLDDEGIEINYAGSSTKGVIESNTEDDLLLLTGLFITNYYWQMTVVFMFILLIPIWSSLS